MAGTHLTPHRLSTLAERLLAALRASLYLSLHSLEMAWGEDAGMKYQKLLVQASLFKGTNSIHFSVWTNKSFLELWTFFENFFSVSRSGQL